MNSADELKGQKAEETKADFWAWSFLVLILVFPLLPFVPFSAVGSAIIAAQFALVAVSLVLLTGWVGQVSLGHAALVGIGAFVAGTVLGRFGIGFPINMLWSALAGAAVAAGLGIVAVRVRGLYLAVATLVFSWMADEFLFRQIWFTKFKEVSVHALGRPGYIPYFDWNDQKTFYYAAWVTVATVIYLLANLRDTKVGRTFSAVRGSEVAAASLGISIVRVKLVSFALSGALAGMTGTLVMVAQRGSVLADQFGLSFSLLYLSIAVVGGLSSLGGAVAAAFVFAALNELFFRVQFFSGYLEVASALLLSIVLLAYQRGLAGIPRALRLGVQGWVDRLSRNKVLGAVIRVLEGFSSAVERGLTMGLSALARAIFRRPSRSAGKQVLEEPQPDADGTSPPPLDFVSLMDGSDREKGPTPAFLDAEGGGLPTASIGPVVLPPNREDRKVLLGAEEITVKFGGLTAVREANLAVREGEIVGLIGPNGAGKTTMFNSIAGLNVPAGGRVKIYGKDVTKWSVDERARLGVGRTFQAIQVFPQLTVMKNLLVAADIHNRSTFLSNLVIGPKTFEAERKGREAVESVVRILGLEDHLNRRAEDLPFGILRMVELARALVTGARLIMLDEPASGLDNSETDKLIEILRFIRSLGVTLLVIEHDVRMVVSIADYIYVLDYGAMLAEGTPEEIQRNQLVIDAYLGAETLEGSEPLGVADK